MGKRKAGATDLRPAHAAKKPLAQQLKPAKNESFNKGASKRKAADAVSRPWLLPQFDEIVKEERDIVIDRIKKEIVDTTAVHPAMKAYIVRGVKHVARMVAARKLRVVVFANNPDVSVGVFGHIPVLCRLHKVPICVLHLSSKTFGKTFNQPSLSVFGIRRLPRRAAPIEDAAALLQADATDHPGEPVEEEIALTELEHEKLGSITDFLVAKASKKTHAL